MTSLEHVPIRDAVQVLGDQRVVCVHEEVDWTDNPHPHPDVILSVGGRLVCATFTYSRVHSPTNRWQ